MPAPSPLEDTILRLPCFEPNSHDIELTGDMLTQHVLFTGATGFGKTTLLNRMLRDLICYGAGDPAQKMALLVYDLKADNVAGRLLQWAKTVGREKDVLVLSDDSELYYDIFAGVRSFESIETLCAKFAAFGDITGDNNAYWEITKRTFLETALYFALLKKDGASFQELICFLNAYLVTAPEVAREQIEGDSPNALYSRLERLARARGHPFAMKAASLLANHDSWVRLDFKTRSNLTSIFANMLQPFVAMTAQRLFSPQPGKQVRLDVAKAIADGKIVVLSMNAIASPELARALGMMLKCDFYQAVMRRPEQRGSQQRLIGLIADEYPLVVTGLDPRFGDVTQLQVMRSRGAFLIACTQGLVNIDVRIGRASREALGVNFGNWFMLHSNEVELDVRAAVILGERQEEVITPSDTVYHDSTERPTVPAQAKCTLVCPPGTLGRLEKHQAFISLANGFKTEHPYWLEPLFVSQASHDPAPPGSDFDLPALREDLGFGDGSLYDVAGEPGE